MKLTAYEDITLLHGDDNSEVVQRAYDRLYMYIETLEKRNAQLEQIVESTVEGLKTAIDTLEKTRDRLQAGP